MAPTWQTSTVGNQLWTGNNNYNNYQYKWQLKFYTLLQTATSHVLTTTTTTKTDSSTCADVYKQQASTTTTTIEHLFHCPEQQMQLIAEDLRDDPNTLALFLNTDNAWREKRSIQNNHNNHDKRQFHVFQWSIIYCHQLLLPVLLQYYQYKANATQHCCCHNDYYLTSITPN